MRTIRQIFDFLLLILKLMVASILCRLGMQTTFAFSVDASKACIIKLESPKGIVFRGRVHKLKNRFQIAPSWMSNLLRRVLDFCRSSGVNFFIWGYADRILFGFDFSDHIPVKRVETGLFGPGARYKSAKFSYVVDGCAPYFDGRVPTDLELMLNNAAPGAWYADPLVEQFISQVKTSKFQKYTENTLSLSLDLDSRDLVVVGQCQGDAAWIETDSIVQDNIDLLLNASKLPNFRNIYYKPHPFNKTNKKEIDHIRKNDIARVIAGAVSFADIALKTPQIAVNTSGAGLEAALRGCSIYTFGTSFYSHWGFTSDATQCGRRHNKLSPEDVFYTVVFQYCRYGNRAPLTKINVFQVQ